MNIAFNMTLLLKNYTYLFTFQISLQQKIQSLDDMTRDRDDAISKLDKANLRLEIPTREGLFGGGI